MGVGVGSGVSEAGADVGGGLFVKGKGATNRQGRAQRHEKNMDGM